MSYCPRALHFCCGCSLEAGVRFIIGFHLIRSLSAIGIAASVIFYRFPAEQLVDGGRTELIALSALGLAGLPLIVAALWGVANKAEAFVRLYFWYMVLGFLVDEGLLAAELFKPGPCLSLPGSAPAGGAFACGAWRGFDLLSAATLTGIEVYFMFVVLSFCESLRAGGEGWYGFGDLAAPSWEQSQDKALTAYMVGPGLNQADGGGYGAILEAAEASRQGGFAGLGGSAKIFGGKRHDLH